MLAAIAPSSSIASAVLIFCFVLVLAFEFSNGFHDTANAVATVIYTNSLKPVPAVVLSGVMNFLGVILGGVAVAFTLVELLPPDVLTPPNGNPAIAMLLALFLAALIWNVATWWLGIPCSSSHAIIGSLLGVAIVNSISASRGLGGGVDWSQVWAVLRALFISPLLGFVLAGALFRILQKVIADETLFEPTEAGLTPPWWVRGLLILTCSGVSFAHGSNDGQKSIGLIMLTIIGIMPAAFCLNADTPPSTLPALTQAAQQAGPLIQRYGDDEKSRAVADAERIGKVIGGVKALTEVPETERPGLRDSVYHVIAELKVVADSKAASDDEKASAKRLHATLHGSVEYAPVWVRMLSAVCLGLGTMIGWRRVVTTVGEKIGKQGMTYAQGMCAQVTAATMIGIANLYSLPVSTTHVLSSGVAGTMVANRSGLHHGTVRSILIAWVLTLPASMLLSAGLFYAGSFVF